MKFTCKSVAGGWQTLITFPDGTENLVGPTFQKSTDLWYWQSNNLLVNFAR